MNDEAAKARAIFIAVTVLCGVFFGLPLLSVIWKLSHWDEAAWNLNRYVLRTGFLDFYPPTEAYLLAIATVIPPLVAYLYWDARKRKAKKS